jgi:hypothetical protein
LETKEQLEEEVEQFVADVQQAAEESTPSVYRNNKKVTNYPSVIRELVMEKRKARRKWQVTRYPGDKAILNRLSNQLKRSIREIKNKSISRFLGNLTADRSTDCSLWKAAKRLRRPVLQDPPLKMQDGTWIGNPKQKADIFAEHLSIVFKSIQQSTSEANTTLIEKEDEQEIPFVP